MDFAGATLDIHPLYLFEGGGLTLNAAIDLSSEVEVQTRPDHRIRVEAVDLELILETDQLEELVSKAEGTPLDLIARILRFYSPAQGLDIRTRNNVPTGSGLGGSSSLLIALSTALVLLENRPFNKMKIIDVGANVEAESIGVPTGKQDYFPACYGGFNALWFRLDGVRRERLTFSEVFMKQLQSQILLGYSGASRFSATNNWTMVKRYIDNQGSAVSKLGTIKKTALSLYQSLKEEDLSGFAACLAQEWTNRKELAPGVTTPVIDGIFEAVEREGALASKVCGAGGGGCFVTLVREGCQAAVANAIMKTGGHVLDYHFAESGVRVVE
jgi:D-glycero-alpha-D-manno-heptose-7-phosphate kinase